MQRCNIRFSYYISDIDSQAMNKVVKYLINGITAHDELVKCTIPAQRRNVIRGSRNRAVTQVERDILALYIEELALYYKQQEKCLVKIIKLCNDSYTQDIEFYNHPQYQASKRDDYISRVGQ